MPEKTPQQNRKAKKALAIMQKGPAAIVEHLIEIEEQFEQETERLEKKFDEKVAELKTSIPGLEEILKRIKGDAGHTPTNDELLALIKPLIPVVKNGETPSSEALLTLIRPLIPSEVSNERLTALIKPLIPVIKAEEIAQEVTAMVIDEISPLIPKIEEIQNDLPKLGPRIRDSLELLTEDERVDESAIKGLDKREIKLSNDLINRAIGIVDQRTSFLINKVSNLKDQVDRLPASSGGGTWGSITGTLSDQTDLQTVLNTIPDNLTDFIGQTAWRVFYSDGSGDVTELALGADGTFLRSNGATSAPTFSTPAGSGDVSKVGTPVNNQIGVWTGDGTIEGDAALTFDTTSDTLSTVDLSLSNDLLLASASVINFDSGDVTITHSLNTLTFAGGTIVLGTATAAGGLTGNVTGDLTGNVTGNVSGTAATVTGAAQAAITTLANLTSVQGLAVTLADAGADAILGWDDSAAAYENLTQAEVLAIIGDSSATAKGVVELATDAEAVTGTDTARSTTPANLTARLAAPGTIGGTTPGAITGTTITANTSILPDTDGGADLGAATQAWNDLFLDTAATINFDNGNVVMTHSSGILTMGTGEFRVTTPGTNAASVPTLGSTSTLTNKTLTSPTVNTATLGGHQTMAENAALLLDPALSADGTYNGIVRGGTAGATLAFGDLCYLDPTDSRWELCDANAASGADGDSRGILGICVLAAAADGSATTMLLHGIVRADTAFPAMTVNAPMYVSETAGDITGTQPTTADVVIRIIGAALTADELWFSPDNAWITHT